LQGRLLCAQWSGLFWCSVCNVMKTWPSDHYQTCLTLGRAVIFHESYSVLYIFPAAPIREQCQLCCVSLALLNYSGVCCLNPHRLRLRWKVITSHVLMVKVIQQYHPLFEVHSTYIYHLQPHVLVFHFFIALWCFHEVGLTYNKAFSILLSPPISTSFVVTLPIFCVVYLMSLVPT
jgi:hypothetical protein